MATDYVLFSVYKERKDPVCADHRCHDFGSTECFGMYKEGVSNAIIIANCLTPLIRPSQGVRLGSVSALSPR